MDESDKNRRPAETRENDLTALMTFSPSPLLLVIQTVSQLGWQTQRCFTMVSGGHAMIVWMLPCDSHVDSKSEENSSFHFLKNCFNSQIAIRTIYNTRESLTCHIDDRLLLINNFRWHNWVNIPLKIHYIAKSIGSPPSNEKFDYFIIFMSTNLNV